MPDIVRYKQGSRSEPDLFQTCSQTTVRKGRLEQKCRDKALETQGGKAHFIWTMECALSRGREFLLPLKAGNGVSQYFPNMLDHKNELGYLLKNTDPQIPPKFLKSESPGVELGNLYFQQKPQLVL